MKRLIASTRVIWVSTVRNLTMDWLPKAIFLVTYAIEVQLSSGRVGAFTASASLRLRTPVKVDKIIS